MPCKYKETSEILEFYVVSTQAPPILGLASCLLLDLIKLILSVEGILKLEQTPSDLLSEYSDVFEGFRTLPRTHKIKLKPGAVAVIHPPRRIPVHLVTN